MMNDFTKEELAIIYCNLCVNPKTKDILIKLQSMIDNYCEHHERVSTSDENGNLLIQCGRCDAVLWHEKD